MGLIDYARIARRRWLIIVVCTVIGLGGAAFYSSSLTPSYTSSSRLYVSVAAGTSVSDSYQSSVAAQQRVTSYVNLVTSTDVVVPVINQLKLDLTPAQLQQKITATFAPATVLITVTVTDTTSEGAKVLNDAVVQNFQALVAQIETTSPGAAPSAKITVVDPATAPGGPAGAGASRYLALGLLVGLLLGCAAAFFRDRLDRTVRSSAQLEEATDGPFLGPFDAATSAEDSKRLALKLEFAGRGPEPRTILAARLPAKPDPELSLSIAKALVDTGARVVVVDASTDGEGVTQYLNASGSTGLADLLRSPELSVSSLLVEGHTPAVSVLPLGQVDDATGGFFASRRFAQMLGELRGEHDYVVIDALSAHDASDILALAARSDGVVTAVEFGSTSIEKLRSFTRSFAEVGSHVIGTVSLTKPTLIQTRLRKKSRSGMAPPKSVRRETPVDRPVAAAAPVVPPPAAASAVIPAEPVSAGAHTQVLRRPATNGAVSTGAPPVRSAPEDQGVVQAAGPAPTGYTNNPGPGGRSRRYTNPYGNQPAYNNEPPFGSGASNSPQGYSNPRGFVYEPDYSEQFDRNGQDSYRRDNYYSNGGYDPNAYDPSAYDPSAYDPSAWPPRSAPEPYFEPAPEPVAVEVAPIVAEPDDTSDIDDDMEPYIAESDDDEVVEPEIETTEEPVISFEKNGYVEKSEPKEGKKLDLDAEQTESELTHGSQRPIKG